MVNPIPKDSDPPGIFAENGLVDLQALDDCGTFLFNPSQITQFIALAVMLE